MDSPTGWQLSWLERRLTPLNSYLNIASYALAFTIIALGLTGYFIIRGATEKLNDNPSKRTAISTQMHKRMAKVTRGHFAVVRSAYLLSVLSSRNVLEKLADTLRLYI